MAEKLAARGWRVCATNWRGGGGELDLVVEHDGKVRFVEVKVRDPRDPLGDDAVGPHKRRLLRAAAEAWLLTLSTPPLEMAFLVAWVDVSSEPWTIRWLDDAF